jgi:hypothetical protein
VSEIDWAEIPRCQYFSDNGDWQCAVRLEPGKIYCSIHKSMMIEKGELPRELKGLEKWT